MERGGEERTGKKRLICLQTRNSVHAAISKGFGLESTAANSYSTRTLTLFKLHFLSKGINVFLRLEKVMH